MSFNSALDAPAYTKLRGDTVTSPTFQGEVYLSLVPNTTIFAARVNQPTFADSFAQVTFDTVTTGAFGDIEIGQTVYVSHTNSISAAHYVGRIRKAPTSSIIYINETSADFDDNDYIFVVDDYRLWDKLARYASSVIYIDYDVTFRQLLPIIYNLKGAYAGFVSSNILTLSFASLAVAAASGASISSWAWDVGDGTITVGSASTQNITATFPPGFRWVSLTVTDSGSRVTTRRIPVWAHDPVSYPPQLLTVGSLEVSGNVESGFDATLPAYDSLSTVLDNTLLCAWGVDAYNGTATTVTSDNIVYLGRLRQSSDTSNTDADAGLVKESRLTIEGPLTQLARIEQLTFEVRYDATPTIWGDIKDVTLWRAIHFILSEFSTFESLYSIAFDSTSNTFVFFGTKTQGGNILSAVNDLAESINAAIQMNASGSAEVVRDGRMLASGSRSSLVTVADVTTSDIIDLQYEHAHVLTVGRMQASGGVYNTASNKVTPLLSLAPGMAQDYPEGQANLTRQVLAANATQANAQIELNQRSGFALAKAQDYDRLTITFPGGYYWLTPSLNQWYTFTLDGSETVRGVVLTAATRWLLLSVTVTHDALTGTKTVQAVFARETTAPPGQTVAVPTVTTTPPTVPEFPPFETIPAFPIDPIYLPPDPIGVEIPPILLPPGTTPRGDGNTVFTAILSILWRTLGFLASIAPDWEEITPIALGYIVKAFALNIWTPNNKGSLCLMSDGNNSTVFNTGDSFASPVEWAEGDTLSGEYRQMRLGKTPGEVYVLGGVNDWCYLFDFTIDDGGFTTDPGGGVWTPGVGWVGEAYGTGGGISGLNILFSNAEITSIAVVHTASGYGATQKLIRTQVDADAPTDHIQGGAFNGTDINTTYLIPGDPAPMDNITFFWDGAGSSNATITAIEVCGVGFDPFAGSTDQNTRYSTDYGDTFATAVVVGPSPGAYTGFDTAKNGNVVLVGMDGQVMKATSGGAFAAYGDPVPTGAQPSCIVIPRYKSNGTSNDTTNPDYYLASSELTAGNEALWYVEDAGTTFNDITPLVSGDYGVATGPDCLTVPWTKGNYIIAALAFGGTPKFVRSITAGSAWVSGGIIDASANYVRTRKNDLSYRQAFLNNGGPAFSQNYRASVPPIDTKSYPSEDDIILIEPWGG